MEIKSKNSGKIYMKTKYIIFSNEALHFLLQRVMFLLHFGSMPKVCELWESSRKSSMETW